MIVNDSDFNMPSVEPILSSDEVRSSIDVLIPDVTGRKSVKSYNCAW